MIVQGGMCLMDLTPQTTDGGRMTIPVRLSALYCKRMSAVRCARDDSRGSEFSQRNGSVAINRTNAVRPIAPFRRRQQIMRLMSSVVLAASTSATAAALPTASNDRNPGQPLPYELLTALSNKTLESVNYSPLLTFPRFSNLVSMAQPHFADEYEKQIQRETTIGEFYGNGDLCSPLNPAEDASNVAADDVDVASQKKTTQTIALQPTGSTEPVSYVAASTEKPNNDPDADPNKLLTLFRDASGQTVASLDEIDSVMRQDQVFTDIRTLQDRITNSQRPVANLVVRHSSQSDNLDITQTEVSQDLYVRSGRGQFRLGFQEIQYDAPHVQGISEYSPGFTGNVRLNDITSLAGELWLNRIDYGAVHSTIPTYDIYFTIRPNDIVRIDIDTNRRTFDNIQSLALGITAQTYGGSIDVMPIEGVKVTLRGSGATYSDHNNRRSEEAESIWRVRTNPFIIELGLRATNFHYTRLLSDGYFNPNNYYSGEGLFRVQSTFAKKLVVEIAGSAGAEKADPGGTKPLLKGSFQAVYKLSHGWSLEGEAAHFSSRESSSSGFSRTSFTAGLHYRF